MYGQTYVPVVNLLMALGTIAVTFGFRTSDDLDSRVSRQTAKYFQMALKMYNGVGDTRSFKVTR